MAGQVRKTEGKLMRAALLQVLKEGGDPRKPFLPLARKLAKMALEGDESHPVTLGAIKEVVDRVDGKSVQEVVGESLVRPTLTILVGVQEKRIEKVVVGEEVKLVESGG